MNGHKQIFILIALVLLFGNCKKNQLGGTSQITGTVMHHSRFIPNARVFIKFNAQDFPGTDTTKYDAKVMADDKGNYVVKCYQGNYYLYAFAYDVYFLKNVSGGIPVKIRKSENLSLDIAVTE